MCYSLMHVVSIQSQTREQEGKLAEGIDILLQAGDPSLGSQCFQAQFLWDCFKEEFSYYLVLPILNFLTLSILCFFS